MSDPRAAIAHWAPRFLCHGVPPADVDGVRAAVERGEDWCRAWSSRAALHEALGKDCLRRGFQLSAGEHLLRASLCFHYGSLLERGEERARRAARLKAAESYDAALPCLRPPGERAAIGTAGTQIAAVLRRPEVAGTTPVLVMLADRDCAIEELHAEGEPFLARGIAVLALEAGEPAVPAALDWIERQTDLDASKVALWGAGGGAPLALRAASQDARIGSCIAIGVSTEAGQAPGILLVKDAGEPHRYRSRTADWLSERFGLPKS